MSQVKRLSLKEEIKPKTSHMYNHIIRCMTLRLSDISVVRGRG